MIYVLLYLYICVISSQVYAQPFAYDRGLYAGQCNEWQKARDMLCGLIVEQPDCAELSYDAGVASFRSGDIKQSVAYFERAASLAENKSLKELAYFNCGNAYAHDKQFTLALSSYESALAINPDNEKTKHNYEVIKKLLEQQEQELEQDNQEQHNDSEDTNDDADSSENENNSNENSDDDNQQNSDENQQDTNNSQQKQNKSSDESKQSNDEQSGDDDQSQSSDKQNQHTKKDEHNKQKNGNDDSSGNQNDNEQESSKHNEQHQSDVEKDHPEDSVEKHDADVGEEKETKGVGAPLNEALEKEENQWIVSLLEQQEAHDNGVNKQLLRARLKEGAASGHSGHNW